MSSHYKQFIPALASRPCNGLSLQRFSVVNCTGRNFVIDDQDMAWAGRLMGLHVKDAGTLLLDTGDGTVSKFVQVLQKAESLRDKIAREEARPITARDIVTNIWDIENASQARGILAMLNETPKN